MRIPDKEKLERDLRAQAIESLICKLGTPNPLPAEVVVFDGVRRRWFAGGDHDRGYPEGGGCCIAFGADDTHPLAFVTAGTFRGGWARWVPRATRELTFLERRAMERRFTEAQHLCEGLAAQLAVEEQQASSARNAEIEAQRAAEERAAAERLARRPAWL